MIQQNYAFIKSGKVGLMPVHMPQEKKSSVDYNLTS